MSIVEDRSGLPGPEDDVKDLTRHQHQGEHGFNIDWHVLAEKRFAVPLLCNIAIALGLSPEALLLDRAAVLIFSSASLFVRHSEPASTAGPAAVAMAASTSTERPGRLSFKEPEAWSHSTLMLKPLMPTGAAT